MSTISERLRNFAQGCRDSMWQSRDETIGLMDEAADTIDALVEALASAAPYVSAFAEQNEDAVFAPKLAARIEAALAMARKGG